MAVAETVTNPFTEEDVRQLLQMESSGEADGWKQIKKKEYVEVWRKGTEDSPIKLNKSFLSLPGVPKEAAFELINNIEYRKQFDTKFSVIEELEKHADFRILYWRAKMPAGVSDRDVVQFSMVKKDESSGTTYILYKNASHPSKPEVSGVVRAKTILSGIIIRPSPDDPEGSCKITILSQIDFEGMIPAFVINKLATKSPIEWRDALYDFYTKKYKKDADC